MFSKKKCPKCGAKNPKYSIACANCGAAFALMEVEDRLEGRKEPIPAWPREVEKEAEEGKAEEQEEITYSKGRAMLRDVSISEDVVHGTDEEDEFGFESRVPCSDGNCIGIIINGRCNICGKLYKG
jgi:uncharacterized Zn finger protein (UPF0148 family)